MKNGVAQGSGHPFTSTREGRRCVASVLESEVYLAEIVVNCDIGWPTGERFGIVHRLLAEVFLKVIARTCEHFHIGHRPVSKELERNNHPSGSLGQAPILVHERKPSFLNGIDDQHIVSSKRRGLGIEAGNNAAM